LCLGRTMRAGGRVCRRYPSVRFFCSDLARAQPTSHGLVDVSIHDFGLPNTTYGVIKMQRPSVNAVNQELLDDINLAFATLEHNTTVRGAVLTSAQDNIFSAGIDFEMFSKPPEDWAHFWRTFQDTFIRIYSSHLITVAAIGGHAPGAGAAFALACKYRVMQTGKGLFGLNEVAVGLPVPSWLCEVFVRTVGQHHAEKMLPVGAMLDAGDALKIGMVDTISTSSVGLQTQALKRLEAAFECSPLAQQITYSHVRKNYVDCFNALRDDDFAHSCQFVGSEIFQQQLAAIKHRKEKKKKK